MFIVFSWKVIIQQQNQQNPFCLLLVSCHDAVFCCRSALALMLRDKNLVVVDVVSCSELSAVRLI